MTLMNEIFIPLSFAFMIIACKDKVSPIFSKYAPLLDCYRDTSVAGEFY